MQPPKVNSKVTADDLARDGGSESESDKEQRGTSRSAIEEDADTDGAEDMADAQERVVERGLTRLPPG
ncbi:hypothetical protein V5740_09230 [Croceibacterium sp. TMG7-5b_MA50]|uniref:hypothetical protein n=1 Tax=Croceibacterium sp. TMG7-5b_MA50 TaxID=3121290 RepID=UPI003221D81E